MLHILSIWGHSTAFGNTPLECDKQKFGQIWKKVIHERKVFFF